jgi:DNA-binding IscR family transcriptional regulator
MADARKLTKLILDPTTMEILNLAIKEKLYPSQIAGRMNKSKSLVTKKLNELESYGIIKSNFSRKGGSVVKKFALQDEEITIKVNFIDGAVKIREKKRKKEKITIKPSERVKELLR